MYKYVAFGHYIQSEIPLQISEYNEKNHNYDFNNTLQVIIGKISNTDQLPYHMKDISYGYVVDGSEQCLLVHVHNIAKYLIKENNLIVIEIEKDADEELAGLFFSGLIMAFIFKQKKYVLLHGSSVEKDETSICIVGAKGSGKSTTAAALTTKGYCVICDDMIPIQNSILDEEYSMPFVTPSIPEPRLLSDAYDYFIKNIPTIIKGNYYGKNKIRVQVNKSTALKKLSTIIILELTESELLFNNNHSYANDNNPIRESGVACYSLSGAEKINAIMEHIVFFRGIDEPTIFYESILRTFSNISVFKIIRQQGVSTFLSLVDLIDTIHNKR